MLLPYFSVDFPDLFYKKYWISRTVAYLLLQALYESDFVAFLLPLPYYRKVIEVLFSVKIFTVEFSPDL